MGAFGDRLRREREMRGITLDEITESTKISRRHLDALEGEHFDQLPGGVFNKGFVRAYARFLGIDEDQAVADYSTASNEQPEPENKFPLEVHQEPDRDLNPRRSSLPLVFAIAALIGVLVGYGFWIKSKPHNPEAVENTRQSAPANAVNAPQANVPATIGNHTFQFRTNKGVCAACAFHTRNKIGSARGCRRPQVHRAQTRRCAG